MEDPKFQVARILLRLFKHKLPHISVGNEMFSLISFDINENSQKQFFRKPIKLNTPQIHPHLLSEPIIFNYFPININFVIPFCNSEPLAERRADKEPIYNGPIKESSSIHFACSHQYIIDKTIVTVPIYLLNKIYETLWEPTQ